MVAVCNTPTCDIIMRQLAEKMIEKNKKLYVVFRDLEKAYDKVCREELWVLLQRYGVSGDLLRAIRRNVSDK